MAGLDPNAQLVQVAKKVRLSGEIVGWVLGDLYQHAKGLLGVIFALNVLGVLARLGVIVVFITFVHAQTSGNPVVIRGFELPSDTGALTLSLWGLLIVLLAAATGALSYVVEVMSFQLARETMDRRMDAAMTVLAAGQSRPMDLWGEDGMKLASRKLLTGDPIMLARAVLLITRLMIPLATVSIATAVLLFLDARLTLILCPLLALYALPLYKLNRVVAKASRAYEECSLERARMLGQLLQFATQTQYPGKDRPAWAEAYANDPSVRNVIRAYRSIILSRRRVGFMQDIFLGLSLAAALVVFGVFLTSGKMAWVPFLTYFIALRYAVMSLGEIAVLVTAVTRFLPQLQRLKEFTSYDLERSSDQCREPEDRTITLHPHEPLIDGTLEQLMMTPGDVLFCFQPVPADAYSLEEFADQLIGEPAASKAFLGDLFLRGDLCAFPLLTVAQIVTGSQAPSREDVQACEQVLKSCVVLDELTGLEQGMQTIMTPQVQQTLSQQCQFAMCLVPGLRTNKKYFLLSWRAMLTMHEESRAKVLSLLSDRVVLLLSNSATKWLPPEASHALLMDATGLRGIGDAAWLKGAVEQRLAAASVGAGAMIESSDLSDDDELMATL